MNVLITGATGFLGKQLASAWSADKVFSLGRGAGNVIPFDLSAGVPELGERMDIVIHSAGKAHVIPSNENENQEFFRVNETGTLNLLKALEKSGLPKQFFFISTVAVYGLDSGQNIDENYPLKGSTPYAQSKIRAEELLREWCSKNKVPLLILRLPLIAGPDAPGNLGAMVSGIRSGKYLSIGNAVAKKSIVLAEDIASHLPAWIGKSGTYNLTDGYHPSFGELEKLISEQLGKKKPLKIPLFAARMLAFAGDILKRFPLNSVKLGKIISSLTFSDEKARKELNWKPNKVLDRFSI